MLRQKESPLRSRRTVRKDQFRYCRSLFNWVVYLKIPDRESLFYVNKQNCNRSTPSNSPRALASNSHSGKGPSRGVIPDCAPHERGPCAPKFEERSHEETLHQERCARKAAWDLAKNVYKIKNSEKAKFHLPGEAKVMSAPTPTKPKEREFIVDSGASMHMLRKKRLKLWRDGHSKKVQNTYSSVDCKR